MSKLFLRHGEVENNKDIFYGNLAGYRLSEKGEEQAKNAANYIFEKLPILLYKSSIIVSTLSFGTKFRICFAFSILTT